MAGTCEPFARPGHGTEPRHRYGNSRTVTPAPTEPAPRGDRRPRLLPAQIHRRAGRDTVPRRLLSDPCRLWPALSHGPDAARNNQLRSGLRVTSRARRLQPVKRIRLFAAVAALALSGVIGMVAATAPSAAAATTTTARASLPVAAAISMPVQPQHPLVSVASFCPIVSGTFRTYGANCTRQGSFLCGGGNTRSINPPAYVSNGCSTRVWLYQYHTLTGRTLCISPRSGTNRLGRTYRAFSVSRNTARCS
jgi:hypothetical protein